MPLEDNKPFPKRPRLKHFEYIGIYTYFLTILTSGRQNYFKESCTVEPLINLLRDTAEKERFSVTVYSFMPDHLHLLVTGIEERSDLQNFVKLYKQKSGFWFKQKTHLKLWHLSYYDHILRKVEAIKDVAMYILNNPVRKGIVNDFKEFQFNGSFTMNIYDL
ncbi:MAG: transposase [Candidatus Brocadiaceae bacterium]|nr:transposase [Candidatus Brocadiaceae bacterium]